MAPPLEWFAGDLLAHLAERWDQLLIRQHYPANLSVSRPDEVWSAFERRPIRSPAAAEDDERACLAFERTHNLASASSGVSGLPPLWLLRQGHRFVVDTGTTLWTVPVDAVVEALTTVGDAIARRLDENDPQKWSHIIERWRGRSASSGFGTSSSS
ncbi:hypothetical protein [Azospirillum halopraeferens]|uniref:hypothetical protein n=1 Tax=Azospirillum halopraeferens TaxID=34010 RepID=UPI0004212F00|nr:hypothetical protein [Azospirillum halopraeferens]